MVPDNLRSGVSRAHRYEPDLNPTYHDPKSSSVEISPVPSKSIEYSGSDELDVALNVVCADAIVVVGLQDQIWPIFAMTSLASVR